MSSLHEILATPALRTELVTVIALCSDSMRRDLLAIFEPSTQFTDTKRDNVASLIDLDEERAPEIDPTDAREARRVERQDLQSGQTQALRRAALTYFDKWQIDVLRRLGEVLYVRPDAIRKARADAKAKAEAAAKSRQDQAYWNWANGQDSLILEADGGDARLLPDGFTADIFQLPKEKRLLVLDSVLLLLLSLEQYTGHSRVLMLNMARVLQLPESMLIENESKVAEGLLTSAAAKMSAESSTTRQAKENANARRWKVGLATFAGAALIGLTGGLAAPVLAAGIGGIMGGIGLGGVAALLGPLATNVVLVGGLFGAYGGRMTGRIMEKYAQEIKDFKFLPVSGSEQASLELGERATEDQESASQLQDPAMLKAHKLRVAIGISGSVTEPSDFIVPWTVFSSSRIEAFGLRWEMDALTRLGIKISEVLKTYAWDFAKFKVLSMVFAGLWPFGLLRAAGALDSPFAIAKTRSDKAGKVLADALCHRVQGARPVTLVGYGLGARVVYTCLLQLADWNAFGIVESVILMGTPAPSDAASWRRVRTVVSGQVVNVFSADDFMLGFLYRASSLEAGIAGVQEVVGVAGVENYDFTDMIKSHSDYRDIVGTVLQRVGFADLNHEAVRSQQAAARQGQDAGNEKGNTRTKSAEDDALARKDEKGQIVFAEKQVSGSALQDEAEPELSQPPPPYSEKPFDEAGPSSGHQEDTDEEEPTVHRITLEDNDAP